MKKNNNASRFIFLVTAVGDSAYVAYRYEYAYDSLAKCFYNKMKM